MEFAMHFRHSNGNLHIKASGGFNDTAAESLLDLFCREYPAGGRVFVDTEGLDQVHPSGRRVLSSKLVCTPVPRESLFFMGEKGFQMAPDGTRVLIVNREKTHGASEQGKAGNGKTGHRCCGKCAHCKCRYEHAD